MYELLLPNQTLIKCEIKYKKIKNIYFKIKKENILLVSCPKNIKLNTLITLINQKKNIIYDLNEKQKKLKKDNDIYISHLYILGKKLNIIDFEEIKIDEANIYFPNYFTIAKIKELVLFFSKKEIDQRIKYWLEKMNIEKKPLFVYKDMKTRWGVYFKHKHLIKLSYNLASYPIEYVDYVIIHELAHIKEFNHSKNFWLEVEKYCPIYKSLNKGLMKMRLHNDN